LTIGAAVDTGVAWLAGAGVTGREIGLVFLIVLVAVLVLGVGAACCEPALAGAVGLGVGSD
jgi:hypothetical protein